MKILVPIKIVIDPAASVSIDQHKQTAASLSLHTFDPFSAVALEQAVRIRQQSDTAVEIITVTIGHRSQEKLLTKAIALGADRALLIETDNETQLCSLDKARILAGIASSESADLILIGDQSSDLGNRQTAAMMATLLSWPHAKAANNMDLSNGIRCQVDCELDDGIKRVAFNLPGLISVGLSLNEPRAPGLIQIMQAKSKPIERRNLSDIYSTETTHYQVIDVRERPIENDADMLLHVTDLVEVIKKNIAAQQVQTQ